MKKEVWVRMILDFEFFQLELRMNLENQRILDKEELFGLRIS